MGQTPPYRAANRYITSTSELLALPGFGRDRYVALAPYVTALPPQDTKVNICTAPGKVLDAYLGPGHSEFGSEDSLAKNRATAPGCFPTKADYDAALDPQLKSKVDAKITQVSSYFRLTSIITIGSSEFSLYSLLYQDRGSDGKVRPILRSFTPD
jgi:general secretion pathway protein K